MLPEAVVVAFPLTIRVLVSDKAVVEAPPFSEVRPVTVRVPESVTEDRVAAPAVRASAPISIAPKAEEMAPEANVPTEVREEVTTPEPRVLLDRTSVPATWYLV